MARLTARVFSSLYSLKANFFHDKLKRWNLNRSKYWLRYGDRGTLNACDQWPIDLTLQNRLYFVFIAEFVERLSTIFPVNIWSTYLFEIEHRWAKRLISDPLPKGTRWISDLKPCPEWIWWITDLKMDLLERNATDQKSWSGFSQRNASLEVWCIKIIQSGAAYLYRTRTRVDHFSKNNQCGMQKSSHSFAGPSGESPSERNLKVWINWRITKGLYGTRDEGQS